MPRSRPSPTTFGLPLDAGLTTKLPDDLVGKPVGGKRARKSPVTPEAVVLRSVLACLKNAGLWRVRNNSGLAMMPGKGGKSQPVRFGEKGASDVVSMLPGGRSFFVECKATGKRLEPHQLKWLLARQAEGAVVLWTDDAAEFYWQLRSLLYGGRCCLEDDGEMSFEGGPFLGGRDDDGHRS